MIATDVPTAMRRPHVWRSSLHEASDQAAMFAPVVKHSEKLAAAEHLRGAVAEAGRAALAPPSRPAYVEIPTDLLAADAGSDLGARATPRRLRRRPARGGAWRTPPRSRDARGRPLIWAGGGALRRGRRPCASSPSGWSPR